VSGWSQTLRNNAGVLRGLAGRLEADPLRPVYGDLEEVWIGPAASELTAGGRAHDRDAGAVGDELRRVAIKLDRRSAAIEVAEQAAAQAAAEAAAPTSDPTLPIPATPNLPPSWY
jgi:hypothetical protein